MIGRKILLSLSLIWWAVLALSAQNSIDKAVEKFSLIGESEFTSAIERDPKTKKIIKIVKILTTEGSGAATIVKAFETEKQNGSSSDSQKNGWRTLIIKQAKNRHSRIYMLECRAKHHTHDRVKTTIIINMKQ